MAQEDEGRAMQGAEQEISSTQSTGSRAPYINKFRLCVAFWLLGLCNNYGYVVMLTAAHDILHSSDKTEEKKSTQRLCNDISTGAILLADILPSLLAKIIGPFFPFVVKARILVAVLCAAAGFLMVAFSVDLGTSLAIVGVVFTSFSSGLGEVTLLQYMSFYTKGSISAWSSGTGAAGVLGAFSYAILSMLGIKLALFIMLVSPVVMFLSFWVILPAPKMLDAAADLQEKVAQEELANPVLSMKKKLLIVPKLFRFIVPLALVYFFEYFINQGLFELVQYDGIFLDKREQYRWLQVAYQVGVFVSRSSLKVVQIRRIWILALLQGLNVVVYLFEAIFYVIPSIWVVFLITVWEGLLGGGAYVNTYYKISKEVPAEEMQFSMSMSSIGDAVGITLAGIISMPVHNAICHLPKPGRLFSW